MNDATRRKQRLFTRRRFLVAGGTVAAAGGFGLGDFGHFAEHGMLSFEGDPTKPLWRERQ